MYISLVYIYIEYIFIPRATERNTLTVISRYPIPCRLVISPHAPVYDFPRKTNQSRKLYTHWAIITARVTYT